MYEFDENEIDAIVTEIMEKVAKAYSKQPEYLLRKQEHKRVCQKTGNDDALNPFDLEAIHQLVMTLSQNEDIPHDSIITLLTKEFGVSDIKHIQQEDFRNAVDLLMSLSSKGVMN